MFKAFWHYMSFVIHGLQVTPCFDLNISFWELLIGVFVVIAGLRIMALYFGFGGKNERNNE